MAAPDVSSLMLPTLSALQDGAETSNTEIRRRVATVLRLTSDDLSEMRRQSPVPVFTNHVALALVHLQRDGLVAKVRKEVYRLTREGVRRLGGPTGDYIQSPPWYNRRMANRWKGEQINEIIDWMRANQPQCLGCDATDLERVVEPYPVALDASASGNPAECLAASVKCLKCGLILLYDPEVMGLSMSD